MTAIFTTQFFYIQTIFPALCVLQTGVCRSIFSFLINDCKSSLKKKEKKIFLINKEIQMEAVAKSFMRKGFLIYEERRKNLVIFEEAVSNI